MNTDNLILIKGGSLNEVKKALHQWIEINSDNLEALLKFYLYDEGKGNYIIVADEELENEKINSLIIYLKYPDDIFYDIEIEGYTTAHDEKIYPQEVLNKRLLIYLLEEYKEYDIVFAVTEDNHVLKIALGSEATIDNDTKTFSLPNIDFDKLYSPEVIKVVKEDIIREKEQKSTHKIEKRFKISLYIFLGLFFISILTLLKDTSTYFIATILFGVFLSAWFFVDYKMLQIDRYYNYCFCIAAAYLGYGFFLKRNLSNLDSGVLFFSSLNPIALLVAQKSLRLIFKRIFNREPVIEKPIPTFWDGIYTILLLLSMAALPYIMTR